MAGSAIERQSGLDLSSNDSYDSLVDVSPKNSAANKDGLLIVSSEGGMKGLTKSYLWEKINAYDQEHFLSDHPEYGQLMPPGGNFLTDGGLQFIRSWIEAGAPKSGNVVDENLLLDTNKYKPKPFSLFPIRKTFSTATCIPIGPYKICNYWCKKRKNHLN